MTKRPRLSANLRMPLAGQTEAEEVTLMTARAVTPEPALQTAAPQAASAPEPEKGSPRRDHLSDIVIDAFTALSLASYTGWSQAVICQWRLSSYVLERTRMRR